jgi:hypothetical protein
VVHGTGDANVDPANYFVGASVARPFRNFYGVEGDWPWFPGYKATIEKAGKATDQTQRKALYHELYGTLVDQGWTIDYLEYAGEAPDSPPRKIDVQRGDTRLRLIVDSWNP